MSDATRNEKPLTDEELTEIDGRARVALADPDDERACIRCRETMAAPDVGLEPVPMHDACAQGALVESARDVQRLARALRAALCANEPSDNETRDSLGQHVRAVWVAWAREQPAPKPSWLVPWERLGEADREVDRRIGEALAREGARTALCSLLDRLGGDGTTAALNREPPDRVADEVYALVQHLEERARWGALRDLHRRLGGHDSAPFLREESVEALMAGVVRHIQDARPAPSHTRAAIAAAVDEEPTQAKLEHDMADDIANSLVVLARIVEGEGRVGQASALRAMAAETRRMFGVAVEEPPR